MVKLKGYQKVATYIGVILSILSIGIMYSLHWLLGVFTALLVAGAYLWWRRMKTGGDRYLIELAERTGLTFTPDRIAYGSVHGVYRGYEVSVEVVSDYNSSTGLTGFVLTDELFDSPIGVVEGVEAVTVVKLRHGKEVQSPYKIDNMMYVDKNSIVYIPAAGGIDGLPAQSVDSLIKAIDRMVAEAGKIN